MNQTIESKNKAFALEAFDTQFNKRDYAAAEALLVAQLHSSTAPISNLVVTASLSSSRASLRR